MVLLSSANICKVSYHVPSSSPQLCSLPPLRRARCFCLLIKVKVCYQWICDCLEQTIRGNQTSVSAVCRLLALRCLKERQLSGLLLGLYYSSLKTSSHLVPLLFFLLSPSKEPLPVPSWESQREPRLLWTSVCPGIKAPCWSLNLNPNPVFNKAKNVIPICFFFLCF